MRAVRSFLAVLVLGLTLIAAAAMAADIDPEKKAAFETELVGNWAVPENKYQTTIEFTFADDRSFTCTYTEPDKDSVEWAGQWKVRSTNNGPRAFLKGQSQQDEAKWMKAVIRSNEKLSIFAILITWDFKGDGSNTWQSVLNKVVPEIEEGGEAEEEAEEETEAEGESEETAETEADETEEEEKE